MMSLGVSIGTNGGGGSEMRNVIPLRGGGGGGFLIKSNQTRNVDDDKNGDWIRRYLCNNIIDKKQIVNVEW